MTPVAVYQVRWEAIAALTLALWGWQPLHLQTGRYLIDGRLRGPHERRGHALMAGRHDPSTYTILQTVCLMACCPPGEYVVT
jgi:hypothetical protein